jgi:hypothetical protein
MLYKAHQLGWNPQYDEASRLVTELLALGATCAANPDERILCLRFRAGYSTNPRYYRSRYVIKNARRFVRGYEDTPGAKSGLSDLFMARLFWQLSQSEAIADTRETARQQANRFFIAALNAIEGDKMDSEAPIHLFPEIMVALHAQLENKKGKVSKNNGGSLALLDYLAQRGFGIYFDAPTEAAAIDAGCRQFAEAQKPDPDDGEEAPGEPTKNQETSATPEEAERLAKEDPRMKIAEDQRAGRYRLWDVIALGIKASRRK